MIRRQNELGEIAVSNNVYTYIAGSAATNCFGVIIFFTIIIIRSSAGSDRKYE